MCDPRNRSALTRNGSLGVRRKFCLIRAFVMAAVGLSKIDTKLGLKEDPEKVCVITERKI